MSKLTYAIVDAERHDRMLRVVLRAEEAVLLPVPEREDHRAARTVVRRGDGPADLEGRGGARRVVGGPVADRIRRPRVATRRSEVVVVGADHDVLVGQLGTRDHREDVGPTGELLLEGVVARARRVEALRAEIAQLRDQIVLRVHGVRRGVVAAAEGVAREDGDVDLGPRAPGGEERDRHDDREPANSRHGPSPQASVRMVSVGSGPAVSPSTLPS